MMALMKMRRKEESCSTRTHTDECFYFTEQTVITEHAILILYLYLKHKIIKFEVKSYNKSKFTKVLKCLVNFYYVKMHMCTSMTGQICKESLDSFT